MKNNKNIPTEKLNESILKGIEKGRQEKPMKSKNSSITIKRVASIVVIGGIGAGLTFPIMAQAITSIEDAIKGFLEIALPERYSEELKNEKNYNDMVVSNDKGTVTLESSVLDNNIFIANLTLESDFLKQYDETDLKYNLYSSIHIAMGDKDNLVGGGGTIKKIEDNKASIVVTSNVEDINIKDSEHIYIKFEGVSIDSNEWDSDDRRNLEGNWKFEYNLDKVDSIKKISVNDEIQIDGNTMTLESIEITPLATYIEITADEKIKDVAFYSYKMIDDKGKIYKSAQLDGHTDGSGKWKFKYVIYDDLSQIDSLNITPYYEDTFIMNKIHDQDLMKMVSTMEENSEIEEVIISRDVEKRDLDVDTKPAHKYEGKKISYQLDIDKERKFYTIDELIGKEIETGNQTSIMIKDIEIGDKNTIVKLKINGDYNILSQIVLFDEDMRDTYNGTYITHKGKWPSNTHWNDTKQIDYMSGETELIIDKIDKNKKYKLAVPLQKEIKLNPNYTMSANLK